MSQHIDAVTLPIWDLFPAGLLIIGNSGKLLASNRAGRDALDQGVAVKESDGAITLSSEAQNRRLRELIARAENGDGSVSALRVPRRPGKPLLIMFVPLRAQTPGGRGPLALLVLNGSQRDPNLKLLAELFDFTPAEAKVAALLMQGRGVFDIASTLGCSASTTRNHLKRMYAKTTTRGQGELVQTLLSSPAALLIPQVENDAED